MTTKVLTPLSILAVLVFSLLPFGGVAAAAPPLRLSYGKAQAEAQKDSSEYCSRTSTCLYWAVSCARSSTTSFGCIQSIWDAGVMGTPGEWFRCDSEVTVTAERHGVTTKSILNSMQCYTVFE